jgi:hypothetical protein
MNGTSQEASSVAGGTTLATEKLVRREAMGGGGGRDRQRLPAARISAQMGGGGRAELQPMRSLPPRGGEGE